MKHEETTVENNDCDFVDIGGVKQSLSDGNRSRKIFTSASLTSAEVVFFHTSMFQLHVAIFIYFIIIFLRSKTWRDSFIFSQRKLDVEFIQLSSLKILNNLRDCMIVFDDACKKI